MDFDRIIRGDRVIVYFTGSFCGPCKKIAPYVTEMANKYRNVQLVKIDVEEHQQIANRENIQSVPTFVAYRRGQKIQVMTGANESNVLRMFHNLSI